MNAELTKVMKDCLEHMGRHDGKLHRFPNGVWAAEGWYMYHGPCYGTPTIDGLVKRKLAAYTAWWVDRQGGKFPIEVTAIPEGGTSA